MEIHLRTEDQLGQNTALRTYLFLYHREHKYLIFLSWFQQLCYEIVCFVCMYIKTAVASSNMGRHQSHFTAQMLRSERVNKAFELTLVQLPILKLHKALGPCLRSRPSCAVLANGAATWPARVRQIHRSSARCNRRGRTVSSGHCNQLWKIIHAD